MTFDDLMKTCASSTKQDWNVIACWGGGFGALEVGWIILDAGDPEAKGQLERQHDYLEKNFEPRRVFVNHLDFQDQLDC